MQKLTRAGVGLASAGVGLLGFGLAMGNLELLVLSAFPLVALATSLAARRDGRATGARTLSTRTPRRGDPVDVEVRVRPSGGADLVEVHQPVPQGFSLESGSNLSLLVGEAPRELRFALRAHARGHHALPGARAESIDPRGLLAPTPHELTAPEKLEVTPRAFSADRLRRRARGRARLLIPEREEARVGAVSTDFRELREYLWGDPPHRINWKATARRLSALGHEQGAAPVPLVNEYEKEGRTTVVILLDGGADMRVGTSLETALDHAVEAAIGASRLFLARGARVAAATFGARSAAPAAPDAGSGQMPRIERALSPGEADPDLTPSHALRSIERHLAGTRPIILVITRITPRNAPEIAEVVRRMRALTRHRRRALPVHVVDVRGLELAPTPTPAWEAARIIVEREDKAAAQEVVASGGRIVPWSPLREDFRVALLRGSGG